MKAYRGVDGKIRIFRPDLNMIRMNGSAQSSGLPTFDGEELVKCMKRLLEVDQEWVPHSESSSLYLRPTLIGIDVSSSKESRNFQTQHKIRLKLIYYIKQTILQKSIKQYWNLYHD